MPDEDCESACGPLRYKALGLNKVQGTLTLFRALFDLANVIVVELPNRPWIDHMHDAYPYHGLWNYLSFVCPQQKTQVLFGNLDKLQVKHNLLGDLPQID